MLKACIGLKKLDLIDRRHWGLQIIPEEVYRHERTLEELLLDFNQIQELPPKFFTLTGLRKLTMSENDLNRIPPGISNFTRLAELDISKNAIEDIPLNMQFCRMLRFLDVSSNPLLRTPENISTIGTLVHLCINDVGIPRLPLDIGNLANLVVLEARENALKTLPVSIQKLKRLQRLDVGNNEIEQLPTELGALLQLTELWLDTNLITELPESTTNLRNLTVLDMTKNRLEKLPQKIATLAHLSDLHLSENALESLPLDLGNLKALTLLQVDLNHLISIPDSIGDLDKVTELLLFDNMLETIPPSLFEMRSLEMLNLDRNHLIEIPSTVGLCKTLHVLSIRDNEVYELPEELGYLPELKVLDIIGNRIKSLPLSYSHLNLDALWLDSDQPQPLLMLESQPDFEDPNVNVLCCSFLPQQGPYIDGFMEIGSLTSDQQQPRNPLNQTGTLGGKGARLGVAFDPSLGPETDDFGTKLVRFPTPFHKDLKMIKDKRKKGKYKPMATPSNAIFRKGSFSHKDEAGMSSSLNVSVGDLDMSHDDVSNLNIEDKPLESLGDFKDFGFKMTSKDNIMGHGSPYDQELREYDEEPVSIRSGSVARDNPVEERKGDMNIVEAEVVSDSELLTSSAVRSIEVTMVIDKDVGQTLGFSIAGGRGSTPAYEDVDDSVYVTKIAPDGVAEKDGRLRLGDKVLSVNHFVMLNATHAEAVAALKSTTSSCHLVISREVLVLNSEHGSIMDEDAEHVEEPNTEVSSIQALVKPGDEQKLISSSPVPPPSKQHHDNYVNFDIAQIVVKESRREVREEELISKSSESPILMLKSEEMNVSYPSLCSSTDMGMTQDNEEEDYPEERVILDRSIGKLGLSVVGGADHVSRVFGQGKPGLYVSKISKGGAAEATGKLKLGDRILEVNKFNVRFSTHQQAVRWLISREGDIEILVQHVPQPPGLMEVSMKKEPGQKLGLSIRGGGKGSMGNPLDPNDEGIFISKVSKGGAVQKEGSLKVGMRIIEVNGTSLLGASHSEAVKTLQNNSDLHIIVCDGFSPQEVLRMKAVADSLDRMSAITDSYVPLSAASSMIMDTAIHGLLSESIGSLTMSPTRKCQTLKTTKTSQSATVPPYFSLDRNNLSRSQNALTDKSPLTEKKDFDSLLEDLAKFKIDISQQVKSLDEMTQYHSSPPPELVPTTLTDIIGPLQNGGIDVLDENAFDPVVEESIATELPKVDTSSVLADLDSQVSIMCDNFSKVELENSQKELKVKKESPPKVKWRSKVMSNTPVNPELASPETRRRAEQIRINISPPPDLEASEEAVKSIIGEVFKDVSFDEFEKEFKSQVSSPYDEIVSRWSPEPDNEVDLISELTEIGRSDTGQQSSSASKSLTPSNSLEDPKRTVDEAPPTKDNAPPTKDNAPPTKDNAPPTKDNTPPTKDNALPTKDNVPPTKDNAPPTKDEAPPTKDNAPPTKDNAPPTKDEAPPTKDSKPPTKYNAPPTKDKAKPIINTINTDHTSSVCTISSEVNRCIKTSHSDPLQRRPAPVVEKKTQSSLLSPETLTFKQKLALHNKVVEDSPVRAARSAFSKPRSISNVTPGGITPKPNFSTPPVKHTSNGGKILSLSGIAPVEVKKSTISDRSSTEEKRIALERVDHHEIGSSSAPGVTVSPLHHNNSSKTIILSNTNSNNSTTTSSPVHLLLISSSHKKLKTAENHIVSKQQMAAADKVTATNKPRNNVPKTLV